MLRTPVNYNCTPDNCNGTPFNVTVRRLMRFLIIIIVFIASSHYRRCTPINAIEVVLTIKSVAIHYDGMFVTLVLSVSVAVVSDTGVLEALDSSVIVISDVGS